MKLTINSNIRDYDVYFEDNVDFIDQFKEISNSVIIIDKNVYNLYNTNFKNFNLENILLFDALEENKTYEYVAKIYDFLISKSAKRNLTIISIGGGITQDITGFVASTLYRGVNWIFVPTTFLAMTDSCIGSKTSLNYGKYKNLIGSFYPPQKIYISTEFLTTLTKLDFYSGVGETIKFQLMKEEYPKDFSEVIHTVNEVINNKSYRLKIIHENMNIKLGYMKGDEFDLGRRNLLNYGHCFGHALETSSDYFVPHGIAVTIGIIFANAIAMQRNLIPKKTFEFLNNNLLVQNIPLKLEEKHLDTTVLLNAMKNDKKRINQYLTVVIPDNEFKMIKIDNVSDEEFFSSLERIKRIFIKGN
ncbi:MAG: hypothetical protein PHW07_01445 [Sulfurospirillaceae bacterium]|nr:hypothetical protein [Sulfurospirillaceae bacterium]